jgi:hypothetical protein
MVDSMSTRSAIINRPRDATMAARKFNGEAKIWLTTASTSKN